MHVATWRSLRRIKVTVRVDPDQADLRSLPAVKFRDTGDSSGSYRIIATDHQRHHSLLKALQYQLGLFHAGGGNLFQILGARVAFLLHLGDSDIYISCIFYTMSEGLQARFEAGNADCRWTHIYATTRLP